MTTLLYLLKKKSIYIWVIFSLLITEKLQAQPYVEMTKKLIKTSVDEGFVPAVQVLDDFRKTVPNTPDLKIWSVCMRAIVLTNNRNFDKALEIADSAVSIARKYNDKLLLANALYARAYVNRYCNQLANVLKDGQEAAVLIEGTDAYAIQSMIYHLLFNVNLVWEDKDKLDYYLHLTDSLSKKEGSLLHLVTARIDNCFYDAEYHNDSLNLIKILNEYVALEHLYEQNPQQLYRANYIVCLFNEVNMRMVKLRSTFNEEELQIAKIKLGIIKKEMKGITLFESLFEGNLYLCYSNVNDIEKGPDVVSVDYITKAYDVFERNPLNPNYQKLAYLSDVLSKYYDSTGNKQKSLFYLKNKSIYQEKFFNQEKSNAIKKLELDNNKTKNELEINALALKSKNTRNIYLFSLIASLMFAIGLVFVIRSYSFKFRYAKEKAAKLDLEKEEITLKALLSDEENKRLAMEREIMELKQDRLQKELLTNQLHIVHKNQVLNDIKEKMQDGQSVNMNKLLREEKLIDLDFENTKKQIQETHPDFFPKLDNMAQQRLTQLDLKLSAYLHINMDTKQIAQALNIESKSVRMAKYRLKQKLGLAKDIDMDSFIRQMT